MTPADPLVALRFVVRVLEGLGVPHFVTGSVASSARGVPRASLDADLVADLRPEQATAVCDALEGSFYVPRGRVREAIAARSSFNVIHLETIVKVDVFVSGRRAFDRRAMSRAQPAVFGGGEGVRIVTATAEDVVLSKLDWFERGGRMSERQWSDLVGVLRVHAGALEFEYLREGAAELAVSGLLEAALAEAAE
jgi:hypothetical protein